MLLPIVLLLATAGSVQQANNAAAGGTEQISKPQAVTTLTNPEPNRFVHRLPDAGETFDKGMIVPEHPCNPEEECQKACASITAFVFSDGETPELKYVTDCPNLDVAPQTERANGKRPRSDQPSLKHTN